MHHACPGRCRPAGKCPCGVTTVMDSRQAFISVLTKTSYAHRGIQTARQPITYRSVHFRCKVDFLSISFGMRTDASVDEKGRPRTSSIWRFRVLHMKNRSGGHLGISSGYTMLRSALRFETGSLLPVANRRRGIRFSTPTHCPGGKFVGKIFCRTFGMRQAPPASVICRNKGTDIQIKQIVIFSVGKRICQNLNLNREFC